MDPLNFLYEDYHSRQKFLESSNSRLVHYADHKALFSIVENQELWLRRLTRMNDFKEFDFGLQLVRNYMSRRAIQMDELKTKHKLDLMGMLHPSSSLPWENLKKSAYCFSLSEHHQNEFQDGRLSMWRGYSNPSGVGLVIDDSILEDSDVHSPLYPLPVRYFNQKQLDDFLDPLVKRLIALPANLLSEEDHLNLGFQVFMLICSLKHPGFSEEREWRLILRQDDIVEDIIAIVPKLLGRSAEPVAVFDLS